MNKTKWLLFTLIVVLGLGYFLGCGKPSSTRTNTPTETEEKEAGFTIQQRWSGAHSSITQPEYYLIKTEAEWKKMWRRHDPKDHRPPKIDFTKQMCVGIFAGRLWNSWGITATVTAENERILLRFDHMSYQTMGGADKVTPFGIFVLSYSNKRVVLEENVQNIKGGASLWLRRKEFGEKGDRARIPTLTGWVWTRQLGTTKNDKASGIAVNTSGYVYVCGRTEGKLDGNANTGRDDAFVVKYDTNGNKQWTRLLGTTKGDKATGIAIDPIGNVYVCGRTDSGLDGNTYAGDADIFVVKYDTNGNKQWTRQAGTSVFDYANGIAVDSSGNVYVTGITGGRLGLSGNTPLNGGDVFVIKYNSAGTKQWTKLLGTTRWTVANGVAVDASGNVYVCGETLVMSDKNTKGRGYDAFVVKYDTNGNKQWTKQLGTTKNDLASGIAVDTSGNVYVCGSTRGVLDGNTNAGYRDLFVIKYNSDGTKQWTKQLGTAGDDRVTGVAADTTGNIYVCGYTSDGLNGYTNAGAWDFFVVKYDTNGNKQWSKQAGTEVFDWAYGVGVDATGNVYICGNTSGGLDGHTNAGRHDTFVVKYKGAGNKK